MSGKASAVSLLWAAEIFLREGSVDRFDGSETSSLLETTAWKECEH